MKAPTPTPMQGLPSLLANRRVELVLEHSIRPSRRVQLVRSNDVYLARVRGSRSTLGQGVAFLVHVDHPHRPINVQAELTFVGHLREEDLDPRIGLDHIAGRHGSPKPEDNSD